MLVYGIIWVSSCGMKVHESKSHSHSSLEEEGKIGTRKHKAESKIHDGDPPASKNKKAKAAESKNGAPDGKSLENVVSEFDEFCKATREHLSVEEIRRILEANGQDSSGPDDAVVLRW